MSCSWRHRPIFVRYTCKPRSPQANMCSRKNRLRWMRLASARSLPPVRKHARKTSRSFPAWPCVIRSGIGRSSNAFTKAPSAKSAKLFAACRQMTGCLNDISAHVMGSQGTATLSQRGLEIAAGDRWIYGGEKNVSQQTEHDELFASIRSGKPINHGDYMTRSTL